MFVRWHVKARSERSWRYHERTPGGLRPWHSPLLTATLVESRRVDGKPRQTVVAYLGGIREGCARHPETRWTQARFWDQVAARLDRLANRIPPAERAAIEAKVAARVYRPTAEEAAAARAKAEAEKAAWLKVGAALFAGRRRSRHPHGISRGLEAEIRAALAATDEPAWAVAEDLGIGERTVVRVKRRMEREAAERHARRLTA